MTRGCEFVLAGDSAQGLQGLLYAAGVTSSTTSTGRLCLTSAALPPRVRSRCHLHRGIDSAGYIARGTVRTWWGERLEHEQLLQAGDFAFIPADLPHVVANAGDEPAFIVVAHSSASDQDGIELLPELDALLDERGA
jgi:uncharacterized RmlC-like cupin family protein